VHADNGQPTTPSTDDPNQPAVPARTTGKRLTATASDTLVPDVRGFSARRAVSLLTMEQFEPVVNGSGIVVRQQPQAGMHSHSRMKIILTCEPKSSANGDKN
jgi:hypothetical protein